MVDESEHHLTTEEEQLLLELARKTLESWVRDGKRPELSEFRLTDTLQEKHAAFVTLRVRDVLRGCVGYTSNHDPLAKTVQDNVINASTHDSRFAPVETEELDDIRIEISALTPGDSPETPFKAVGDVSEIIIGRDGLYIERPPARGGLLLPQVPVEEGWDIQQFLQGVCHKAGYAHDAWKDPQTRLYRFSAQVFSE